MARLTLKPLLLAGAFALAPLIFTLPAVAQPMDSAEVVDESEEQEGLVEYDAEVAPDEPIVSINDPDFDYIAREQIMRTALEHGITLSREQIDEMGTAMADFARMNPQDMDPETLEVAAEELNQTIMEVLTEEQFNSIMGQP